MGSISLARLVQTLRTLSQDCLGLTIICLACIIGCTASDTTDSVPYKQWAGPAAAMMYSMLDPKIASARHAALTEFRGRDESERNRSVNVQSTKVCSASLLFQTPHKSGLLVSFSSTSLQYQLGVQKVFCLPLLPCFKPKQVEYSHGSSCMFSGVLHC